MNAQDQINIGDKVCLELCPDVVGKVRSIKGVFRYEFFLVDWPAGTPHAGQADFPWSKSSLRKVTETKEAA